MLYKDVVYIDTLNFKLTRELLAEAIGILDEREFWFKKVPFTFDAQRYLLPGVAAYWGKGLLNCKIVQFRKIVKH